ncbi:Oxidative Stress-Induced Growth Inhibitor 1 [Manis pentadactyla]|nr:Oxidative Stress-Induced Growth Inhibitor 1 [Manis pentadactyla]
MKMWEEPGKVSLEPGRAAAEQRHRRRRRPGVRRQWLKEDGVQELETCLRCRVTSFSGEAPPPVALRFPCPAVPDKNFSFLLIWSYRDTSYFPVFKKGVFY